MSCYVCGVPVYSSTRAESNKYFAFFSILQFQPPTLTGLVVHREQTTIENNFDFNDFNIDDLIMDLLRQKSS